MWLVASASAAILEVGPGRAYTTLDAALAVAVDGDEIHLDPGVYLQDIDLAVSVTLVGAPNPSDVVLAGGEGNVLLSVDAGSSVVLEGLTLDAESFLRGAWVEAGGSLVATNVVFTNCAPATGDGGCLQLQDSATAVLDGCAFDSPATVAPFEYGGQVYVGTNARLTASNSTFRSGVADRGGAVALSAGAAADFVDCTFEDNQATDPNGTGGGAVYSTGGSLTFTGCSFARNRAPVGDGGAIQLSSGSTLDLRSSRFVDDFAGDDGGHVAVSGNSTVTVDSCTFLRGRAVQNGGALLFHDAASARVTGSSFEGNFAGLAGGAVFTNTSVESLDLAGNWLCGNRCAVDDGGAVAVLGSGSVALSITNNAFVANAALADDGGHLSLTPSAIAGAPTPSVQNNDFVGGTSGDRGEAVRPVMTAAGVAPVDFRNNLVAYNGPTEALDVAGALAPVTVRYDAWFGNGADSTVALDGTNLVGLDPLLNAVPAGTCSGVDLSRRTGSPLVDAGDPAVLDGDGSASDIGAFGSVDAPACPGADLDGDGLGAACDACPFDVGSPDADGDGVCDGQDACPRSPDQVDGDSDGQPDACDPCPSDVRDDRDGDGLCDGADVCPDDAGNDDDGDGVCFALDPCPFDNPDDSDGDTVCDADDPCPLDNPDDSDGDGACDSDDPCPADPRDDSDGDTSCDSLDRCPGGDDRVDSDGDGTPDDCEAPVHTGDTGLVVHTGGPTGHTGLAPTGETAEEPAHTGLPVDHTGLGPPEHTGQPEPEHTGLGEPTGDAPTDALGAPTGAPPDFFFCGCRTAGPGSFGPAMVVLAPMWWRRRRQNWK